jgi:hypothetical protein
MPVVSPDFVKDATTLGLAEFAALARHLTSRQSRKGFNEHKFLLCRLCVSQAKSFCGTVLIQGLEFRVYAVSGRLKAELRANSGQCPFCSLIANFIGPF